MKDKITVLITENVDKQCLGILISEGFNVDYKPGIARDDLLGLIETSDALIVRSHTKVDAAVLEHGRRLKVVGRAGAGVDNIDVDAATRRGIIVMNTPGGNTIAATEHTLSMMLALTRNIPQADQSMKLGKWERERFVGAELHGKILGIIGFGKIGAEVAKRCRAFDMRVLAFDPAQPVEHIRRHDAEPADLEQLLSASDFISIHAPLIRETRGLLNRESFRKCKIGVRIINCARGGIVNEHDLLEAVQSGKVAGAALDVFEHEPPGISALITHPRIIVTPHLGASTSEAQERVAIQIARQITGALRGTSVTGSVNADLVRIAMKEELQPFLKLAEAIGKFISQTKKGALTAISLTQIRGESGDALTALGSALIKGLYADVLDESVNYLNAHLVAQERGLTVQIRHEIGGEESPHAIEVEYTTEKERRSVAGTVLGSNDIRLTRIDQFHCEVKPEGHLLMYTNPDRPGMLARVAGKLAEANINIAGLSLGRYKRGEKALTIISVDDPVDPQVLNSITSIEGIEALSVVHL